MAEKTPVGVAVWTQMAKAVNDLHSFVKGSRFLNKDARMQTVVGSEWANFIERAKQECTVSLVAYKMEKALNTKIYLDKAHLNLTAWPGRPSKYAYKEQVLGDITTCINLVNAFRAYCNSMFRYTTILGTIKIEQCELATHLISRQFSNKVALEICNGLGAVLPLHLTYVRVTDIQQLGIGVHDQRKLEQAVMTYCDSLRGTPGQLRPGAQARLDCMRACLLGM